MKEYLYILNYPPYEKDLCLLEFKSLFDQEMTTKYFITNKMIDYNRSVFIRSRIDILKRDKDFQQILHYINKENLTFYEFKVTYLKNEDTHVSYQEAIDKCKQIAFPINGSVNMQNPKVSLIITKIKEEWIFGIQHINYLWNKHENKPHTYSYSLSLRLARSLINIGIGQDFSLKVVDPCCGIGTVVLEGLGIGAHIKGYDISKDVAYKARLNLEYYGYDPHVIERKDMHDIDEEFDVCLLDIPYGLYSTCTYEQQVALLKSAYRFSKKLVLVTLERMDEELEKIGYNVEEICEVGKNETFSMIRYITICQRKEK